MSGPLSGIHGLDLTSAALGPVATRIAAATGFRKDKVYRDRPSFDVLIQGKAIQRRA
jgi:crotonobetainyl-CoA:carnitine CoA-transferase CaiB-like acyl-CoA transferase